MRQVDILIAVDVLGVATNGSLRENLYMVDTNKYLGSWDEGSCDLHTLCQDAQIINWRITSVNPDEDVSITGFSGDMIDKQVCIPKKTGDYDPLWSAEVLSRQQSGRYAYTVDVSVDGRVFTFDPYLEIQG